ncbi:hypothetical protein [Frondihabitans cladoniiphilus]|uniref:DNA/RNA endonuclease G n=1 Tax=Frondihabitans cladoniiphilus TaxID=715785 RepID=A0ABP8W222_9MICO
MTLTTDKIDDRDGDAPRRLDGPASSAAPVSASTYRRILRRETHSSRSGAAVVFLIVLLLVAAYVGTEAVYAALNRKPLLFSPTDVLSTLVSAVSTEGGLVLAVGIATGVLGIILLIIAFTAGRRGRHTVDDSRVAVVVDDQVIAASLAHRARLAGSLAPGQVNAWVARSHARITVTPASGAAVDEESLLAASRAELDGVAYRPAVIPTTRVTPSGRLGA